MRTNLPVSNIKHELREGASLVSQTDLRGNFTYANLEFLEASGYTEKELMGQPHNIVRHPDMPPEVFEDLWRTLKSGKPWTCVVKNRRKDGSYYWVLANVTPVFESSNAVGYLSVRSKPTRAQIEAHEAVYRLFRDGKQGNLRIKVGKAVAPRSWLSLGSALDKLNEKSKINLAFLVMMLALLVNNLIAHYASDQTEAKMAAIVTQRMESAQSIAAMQTLMSDSARQISQAIQHDPAGKYAKLHDHPLTSHTDGILANSEKVGSLMKTLDANARSEESRSLLAELKQAREAYLTEGLNPVRQMLLDGNYEGAARSFSVKASPLFEGVNKIAARVSEHELTLTRQANETAIEEANKWDTIQWLVSLVSLLLGAFAAVALGRNIVGSLSSARHRADRIAQGHYHDLIEIERDDESGKLMCAVKNMQIRMGFEIALVRSIANDSTRVKFGLDHVDTSMMIADLERRIVFVNKAGIKMFRLAQDDIRKELPEFDANSLLGASIDLFHKNPAHQAQLLDRLRTSHKAVFNIGGLSLAMNASAIFNDAGEHVGTRVEWKDCSAENAMQAEISNLIVMASQGDLTQRIAVENKTGFFLQVAEIINVLLETADEGTREVARMLHSLAQGDLTDYISNEYHGTFGQLKDDANATSSQLKKTLNQIREATDTINTAAGEIAAGNLDLSQRTEAQASSLEETAASMEELTSTVKQTAENAGQANQLALSASLVAEKGGVAVRHVISTMDSINDSSHKIVDIISVIDSIAFQTNILSLNAAVEAARAGEQGRGFAVVASEVRSLAQRSASAAKEIKILIGDSVSKVEAGSRLVNDAGKTMEEIVMAVKRVTDIISEISAAAAEQSIGIQQVNKAVTQIESVTHQNAALVEQASAAASSLADEAQNLTRSVNVFKMGDEQRTDFSAGRAASKPATGRAALGLSKRTVAVAKPKALPIRRPDAAPKASKVAADEWEEF